MQPCPWGAQSEGRHSSARGSPQSEGGGRTRTKPRQRTLELAREGFVLPALLSQGGQVPEEGLWGGCLSPVLPGLEAGRAGRWGGKG